MFTGIVEETGKIKNINRKNNSAIIEINCKKILENTKIGDSIAVNGICLTVTQVFENYFTSDVMPETINRTSLETLSKDDIVNLERAVTPETRLGRTHCARTYRWKWKDYRNQKR